MKWKLGLKISFPNSISILQLLNRRSKRNRNRTKNNNTNSPQIASPSISISLNLHILWVFRGMCKGGIISGFCGLNLLQIKWGLSKQFFSSSGGDTLFFYFIFLFKATFNLEKSVCFDLFPSSSSSSSLILRGDEKLFSFASTFLLLLLFCVT